jgi:hypothetical protein
MISYAAAVGAPVKETPVKETSITIDNGNLTYEAAIAAAIAASQNGGSYSVPAAPSNDKSNQLRLHSNKQLKEAKEIPQTKEAKEIPQTKEAKQVETPRKFDIIGTFIRPAKKNLASPRKEAIEANFPETPEAVNKVVEVFAQLVGRVSSIRYCLEVLQQASDDATIASMIRDKFLENPNHPLMEIANTIYGHVLNPDLRKEASRSLIMYITNVDVPQGVFITTRINELVVYRCDDTIVTVGAAVLELMKLENQLVSK